jgi:hypothetical protein
MMPSKVGDYATAVVIAVFKLVRLVFLAAEVAKGIVTDLVGPPWLLYVIRILNLAVFAGPFGSAGISCDTAS